MPLVMAFHLGSLSFLTPYNLENFQIQVTQVIQGKPAVVLWSWLKVKVMKELREKKLAISDGTSEKRVLATDLDTEVRKQVMQCQVLKEV